MATVFIAVVLVCGFIFVNLSLSKRYRYKRSEGWDAYFFVASWGFVFVFIGWLSCSILSVTGALRALSNLTGFTYHHFSHVISISTDADGVVDGKEVKILLWMVVSIMLALICGCVSKLWTLIGDKKWDALAKAVGSNPYEVMLMEASARQVPVIVTLGSKKFYVGLVICPAFEHGESEYLELIPLLSGYRNKDNLTINITTNYRQHYLESGISAGLGTAMNRLTLNDFRVVAPRSEVETISFFDLDTYQKFKDLEQ
ncbi:hypothetical protein [Aeromonas caviae]|jgi:hypothetical protein|uniref:hypothetical protein n=1 Tax=Aeromonas caviae TaxID=648 RepID=UPI0029DDF2A4|nr:hypothetical protein [Aeromonas caviae]MDX7715155.1 hypothetical protein [Aeromonas caviae]